MDKEIPSLPEKNSRAARLRQVSQNLLSQPLERPLSEPDWDTLTSELTRDDLDRLKNLAAGHRDSALAEADTNSVEWLAEARASILLWPRDPGWLRETFDLYHAADRKSRQARGLLAALSRRLNKGKKPLPRVWWWPLVGILVIAGVSVLVVLAWNNGSRDSGISPVQGPRDLQSVFDTQGVKANIQVAQSRMILFPDATVAELSAWVTFPEHRVEVWEGQVLVLDASGQPLTRRDVTFRTSSQGPLEPGQGVEIFEQFDAHPFFDRVSSFQVVTTRILAREANPKDRREMELSGRDTLTSGYNLRVWILGDDWTDRFASKVHTMALELENAGLRPFAELRMALVWKDDQGNTLKTLNFRPVSPFRTALPSGGRLAWTQETVFDTEVFHWDPGQEPHPILELLEWQ